MENYVMVQVVEAAVMRGGYRLVPGSMIRLPTDVADDACRAGFARVMSEIERAVGPGYERTVVEGRGYRREMTAGDYGIAAVRGIGSKRQRQLTAMGVTTVADLLAFDAKTLAKRIDGVGTKTAAAWLETARMIAGGEL